MKLYAVTVKAQVKIAGRVYPARELAISKLLLMPLEDRVGLGHVPAVFTNKAKALAYCAMLKGKFGHDYRVIDFDSGMYGD